MHIRHFSLLTFAFLASLSLSGCALLGLNNSPAPLSAKEACTEMWKFGKCLDSAQGQIQIIRLTDIIKLDYPNNVVTAKGYAKVDGENTAYLWNSAAPPTLSLAFKSEDTLASCKHTLAEREYPIQVIAQGTFKGAGKFELTNIVSCESGNIVDVPSPEITASK